MFGTMVKTEDGDVKMLKLVNASDTPIRRHIKIKAEAHPFNPAWEEYFESRNGLQMKENLRGKNKLLFLWYAQEGKCPNCDERITKDTGWNIHYLQRTTSGGENTVTYLMILHPNCNRQMHNREKKVATSSGQTEFIEA